MVSGINFDKLAYDLITGKEKRAIAQELAKGSGEELLERIEWFEQGLLCSRRLLVIKDRDWYAKTVKNYRQRVERSSLAKASFKKILVRNFALSILLFIFSILLLWLSSLSWVQKLHILLPFIFQVFGIFSFLGWVFNLIWLLRIWFHRNKKHSLTMIHKVDSDLG